MFWIRVIGCGFELLGLVVCVEELFVVWWFRYCVS